MIHSAAPNFSLDIFLKVIVESTLTLVNGPIVGATLDETAMLGTITDHLSAIAGTLFSTDSILYDLLYATGIQRFFTTLTQSLTPS